MTIYPDTAEKRKAGMAAFRAKMLLAHESVLQDKTLSAAERAYQSQLIATIKAAQIKFGEVS